MLEKEAVVQLKTGLQARPAALFVQEANRFGSDLYVEKEGKKVNAKSIMGIMSLAIAADTTIKLMADGHDADDALETLAAFVSQKTPS